LGDRLLVPPRVKDVGVRPILLLLLELAETGVLGMERRRDPDAWVSKLASRMETKERTSWSESSTQTLDPMES